MSGTYYTKIEITTDELRLQRTILYPPHDFQTSNGSHTPLVLRHYSMSRMFVQPLGDALGELDFLSRKRQASTLQKVLATELTLIM